MANDHMVKQNLQRLIMVAFGLLGGLLLGEVLARVVYPIQPELRTSEVIRVGIPPAYIQYVERMPWSHSVTKYEIEGEYSTTVSINGKGLRGPEVAYDKADDEFRILYIGDSYVKAVQVEFEETVYHRLESLLKDKNKEAKVIGAGESGWGTDQAYQYYRYEGYKYRPDLVIYQFVTNDVSDNMRDSFTKSSGLKQHFSIKDGKPVERNLNLITRPSFQYEISLHRHLLLLSRLYTLANDIRQGGEVSFLGQQVYHQVAPLSASPPAQLLIYQEPYSDVYQAAWELTEAIISKWKSHVEANGASFIIISVPGRWAIHEEDWQEIPQTYPHLAPEFSAWNRDKPDEYLNDIAQRHNILYRPLTAPFRAYAANNSQRLYFTQDGHWTKAGHTLAAQAIFDWLEEKDLLKPLSEISRTD